MSPNFHLSGSADSEKRLQTTHSEQTAASWYKVKSRKEAATNLRGARQPQPGNLVVGLPLLDYVLPDIATIFVGRNISGMATISISLYRLAALVHIMHTAMMFKDKAAGQKQDFAVITPII